MFLTSYTSLTMTSSTPEPCYGSSMQAHLLSQLQEHLHSIAIDIDSMPNIVDMTDIYSITSPLPQSLQVLLPPLPPPQMSCTRPSHQTLPMQSQASSQHCLQSVSVHSEYGHSHWDQDLLDILIWAVHSHNPFKLRSNQDKSRAWSEVYKEMKTVLASHGLQDRSLNAIKLKWTKVTNACKREDTINRCSLGIVEFHSDIFSMLDEVIQSDVAQSYQWPTKSMAKAHRQELATLTLEPGISATSQSLSLMQERSLQQTTLQTLASSQSVANDESKHSFDSIILPSPLWK